MSKLDVRSFGLRGAFVVKPTLFRDIRGVFSELWNRDVFAGHGVGCDFVQDNWSQSIHRNTIRGLHYQAPPYAQDKLVRVMRGRVLDVIVDIRKGSPTFGQSESIELSAENGLQVFVPKGFLHGFITREPNTEVFYKCSARYAPECEGAVRFDDPDLAIEWGTAGGDVVLSEKDAAAQAFRSLISPFTWEPSP